MLRSCNMTGWEKDFFSADLPDHTMFKEHDASNFRRIVCTEAGR